MLVLASSSQTRAEILRKNGIDFKQVATDFDEESIKANTPREFVYKATMGKLQSHIKTYGLKNPVLCADSVVVSQGEILRKAKSKEEAREILKAQSENEVSIITCMVYKSEEVTLYDISSTTYEFDTFDEEDLEEYLKSNDWQGKAGACMVEGFCKKYILNVRGLESTAMGLCVEKLLPFLTSEKK